MPRNKISSETQLMRAARIRLIAHRGNTNGVDAASENRLLVISNAIERGFSVEIDVRTAPTGRYLSHDVREAPHDSCDSWSDLLAELKRGLMRDMMRNATFDDLSRPIPRLWINVKDTETQVADLAADVIDQLGPDALNLFAFFDLELVHGSPRARALGAATSPDVQFAWRWSDLPEEGVAHLMSVMSIRDVYGDWIWLDGMTRSAWWSEQRQSVDTALKSMAMSRNDVSPRWWRIALVAPDLHGETRNSSLGTVIDVLRTSVWPVAVCSDYVADPRLVEVVAEHTAREMSYKNGAME